MKNEDILVAPKKGVNRVLEEAKLLEEKWSKTIESLKGITDSYKRASICLLLENQRLMNECVTSTVGSNPEKFINLVVEVFPNLLAWNLISIQPLLGPVGLIYFLRQHQDHSLAIESQDICARTRKLKRRVCRDFGPQDVARDVIEELDTEFLKDLYNNCGTVGCVNLKAYKTEKAVRLEESLHGVFKIYSDKLGRKDGYWMVANKDLYSRLKPAFDNFSLTNSLPIYPHVGVEGVLMGNKGDSYMDSGYVYSPYIPFTLTPCTWDNTIYNPSVHGLLTRYGKVLLRDGANYYAKVTVLDEEQNG